MGISGGNTAFATIGGYRLVWIPGPFGNGKTAFAMMAYALYFRPRGYRLVTNIKSIFTENLDDVGLDENGNLRAFILIDEGGQYFDTGKDVFEMMRNPRKMDYIFCFPSFIPPHRAAQILQVQPLYSWRSAGVPVTRMEWRAKIGTYKASGRFWWSFPQSIYGTYSTKDPASSPADIRLWLQEKTKEYRRLHGYDAEDQVDIYQASKGVNASPDSIDFEDFRDQFWANFRSESASSGMVENTDFDTPVSTRRRK
jgi:hypothetical protein